MICRLGKALADVKLHSTGCYYSIPTQETWCLILLDRREGGKAQQIPTNPSLFSFLLHTNYFVPPTFSQGSVNSVPMVFSPQLTCQTSAATSPHAVDEIADAVITNASDYSSSNEMVTKQALPCWRGQGSEGVFVRSSTCLLDFEIITESVMFRLNILHIRLAGEPQDSAENFHRKRKTTRRSAKLMLTVHLEAFGMGQGGT
jgi:hypothetical protein